MLNSMNDTPAIESALDAAPDGAPQSAPPMPSQNIGKTDHLSGAKPGGDGLAEFLAEYEASTQAKPEQDQQGDQQNGAKQPPAPAGPDFHTKAQLEALNNWAHGIDRERKLAVEKADFEKVVDIAKDKLKDFPHLPEDFAQRWFVSEATMNPALRQAFDRRNDSPQARAFAERAFKRAVNSLYETARKQPDPDATADRNAVRAALKGWSGSPPPEQPVNLGGLNNNEFNQFIKEKYGINRGV